MKINSNEELLHTQFRSNPKSQGLGQAEAFADLLKARMAADQGTATSPGPTAVGVIPLSGVQLTAPSDRVTPAALTGTEHLLDLMETYRLQLADRASSLNRISPTVRQMAEALPALEEACDRLPAEDGLRQAATRAMVTARLEIMRFVGGEYNVE